ncbi:hypothetical protein ACFJGV_10860 [Cnuibacter sp. UC19_7]|uniref:hypothetical protein n=1 Tax=Cnuibacter sp. UC19_7 TaxID=3350166 RepID=UPI003671C8C7
MTVSAGPPSPATQDAILPGAAIIARIRFLLIVASGAGVVYGAVMRASSGFCPGGVRGDGGYTDAHGQATTVPPSCITLTLGPNPLVFVALAVIVVVAVTRILRRAQTQQHAIRIANKAAIVVVAVAAGSLVIAYVWFVLIPVQSWVPDEPYFFLYPFPFGTVDTIIKPLG